MINPTQLDWFFQFRMDRCKCLFHLDNSCFGINYLRQIYDTKVKYRAISCYHMLVVSFPLKLVRDSLWSVVMMLKADLCRKIVNNLALKKK